MKKLLWFGLALMVFAAVAPACAQNISDRRTITLHSVRVQPTPHDFSRSFVDLQRADYATPFTSHDLEYGSLRVGEDWDWFGSRGRSLIVDLGKHAWTDSFTVPWIEPLTLEESRHSFINSNGAPGKGAPDTGGYYEGLSALPGSGASTNPDVCCNAAASTVGPTERTSIRKSSKSQPQRPAGPETSRNLLRANVDHMYVIHVVNGNEDFYALFRVDAVQRGDSCTISWKMIPPPPQPAPKKTK